MDVAAGSASSGSGHVLPSTDVAKAMETACAEVVAAADPAPTDDPITPLAWHRDLAYTAAGRLGPVAGSDEQASALVAAITKVGNTSEYLVTVLEKKKVDDAERGQADAARAEAIGGAASISAQLGTPSCTTIIAGPTG